MKRYISKSMRIVSGDRYVTRGTKYSVYRDIYKFQVRCLGLWWTKYWLWDSCYRTIEKFIDHFLWKFNRK